jgi:predicted GNAT family acetyltransferase
LARETGFKVRESKLTPQKFLDVVVFKDANGTVISLEDHCIALKQRWQLNIKKQSLSERFNEPATFFIKALLDRQLSGQITADIQQANLCSELAHFTSVKIKDSTRFQVHESLKEHYPGSTGAASGAGIHIQYEFDMLGGRPNVLSITDALQQDSVDAQETMENIEPGSLIIRDLGYFSTRVLEEADKRGAYYITRARHRMIYCYADTGKEINFSAVYNKMKKKKLSHMEIPIVLGKTGMGNRLIVELLPEKEVEKRIAKAASEGRKKGRQLSQEYKCRARLNLFITNVPAEWISTEKIRTVYRLRWQIELRFKAWKSFFHLDAIKKMHRHRFECYLYATLLLLMINIEIGTSFFAIIIKHAKKPLSILKFYKTASLMSRELRAALLAGGERLVRYLAVLYEISYNKLLTEKRKGQSAALDDVLLENIA